MIYPFEKNYFYSLPTGLFELPEGKTHGQWIDENKPGNSRESLCEQGWIIVATFNDRHVFQTYGFEEFKLKTIHEIIDKLPLKENILIQTSNSTCFELKSFEMMQIDESSQLWPYKIQM
jgi:hypothetical protein